METRREYNTDGTVTVWVEGEEQPIIVSKPPSRAYWSAKVFQSIVQMEISKRKSQREAK